MQTVRSSEIQRHANLPLFLSSLLPPTYEPPPSAEEQSRHPLCGSRPPSPAPTRLTLYSAPPPFPIHGHRPTSTSTSRTTAPTSSTTANFPSASPCRVQLAAGRLGRRDDNLVPGGRDAAEGRPIARDACAVDADGAPRGVAAPEGSLDPELASNAALPPLPCHLFLPSLSSAFSLNPLSLYQVTSPEAMDAKIPNSSSAAPQPFLRPDPGCPSSDPPIPLRPGPPRAPLRPRRRFPGEVSAADLYITPVRSLDSSQRSIRSPAQHSAGLPASSSRHGCPGPASVTYGVFIDGFSVDLRGLQHRFNLVLIGRDWILRSMGRGVLLVDVASLSVDVGGDG